MPDWFEPRTGRIEWDAEEWPSERRSSWKFRNPFRGIARLARRQPYHGGAGRNQPLTGNEHGRGHQGMTLREFIDELETLAKEEGENIEVVAVTNDGEIYTPIVAVGPHKDVDAQGRQHVARVGLFARDRGALAGQSRHRRMWSLTGRMFTGRRACPPIDVLGLFSERFRSSMMRVSPGGCMTTPTTLKTRILKRLIVAIHARSRDV